jgi:hypothetical protein
MDNLKPPIAQLELEFKRRMPTAQVNLISRRRDHIDISIHVPGVNRQCIDRIEIRVVGYWLHGLIILLATRALLERVG